MPSPESALRDFSAVVITGGSSGIGKSFIEQFGKLCPELSFCNLSRRTPDMDVSKLKLRHIPCDLSDPGQVASGIAGIRDFLGRDAPKGRVLLINNSGFGSYGRFPGTGVAEQLDMVDVNVRAVVQMTGELLPLLKERGGVIVTVSSVAAFQPTPFLATYGAAKAFVLHWSLALDFELRGSGVRALAVCPGPTSTDFFKRAGLEKGAVPDVFGETCEDVVNSTLKAMARGKSMVVSGWLNKVGMALTIHFPKPFITWATGLAMDRMRLKRAKK